MTMTNPWMTADEFDKFWTSPDQPVHLTGIDIECKHAPTGLSVSKFSYSYDGYDKGRTIFTVVPNIAAASAYPPESIEADDDTETVLIVFPSKELRFRLNQKQLDKYQRLFSLVEEGDWVRCSGTRGRYKWRRVLSIDASTGTIFGQCAEAAGGETKPFTSTNGIITIRDIVKGAK